MSGLAPALLDVNALFALAWPTHQYYRAAHRWLGEHRSERWATTPITQSGFVRLSCNGAVTAQVVSPATACTLLREITNQPGHEFWADDVDGVVSEAIDVDALRGYRQITDAHLISLAHRRGGHLATFDAKLADIVRPGFENLVEVIE